MKRALKILTSRLEPFLRRMTLLSLVASIALALLSFQNCSNGGNISFQSLKSLSLSSQANNAQSGGVSGNGSGYEGKPEGVFIRNLPGTICEKPFEVLEIDKSKQTVKTTSQSSCETTTRTIDDSQLDFSQAQQQVVAVGDGLFVNAETLDQDIKFAQSHTQVASHSWCQAEIKNDSRFDVLVFEDFKNNQLTTRVFKKDLTIANGMVSRIPDFTVTSTRNQRELQLAAPSFILKIDLTSLPKVSNGKFNATLEMTLDQKKLSFANIDCRAGGTFDGAIWPSRIFAPTVSNKVTKIIGFHRETNTAIVALDPVEHVQSLFSLSLNENSPTQDEASSPLKLLNFNFVPGEYISLSGVSTVLSGKNLLVRTIDPNSNLNRNRVFDLVSKQNYFTTDANSFSTDIGASASRSWSLTRAITGQSNDGNPVVTGPEMFTYFPNDSDSQQALSFESILHSRHKFFKFIYQDAKPKDDRILFAVAAGESAEVDSQTGNIRNNFTSMLPDLAILDEKTGQVSFLRLWTTGINLHMPFLSDRQMTTETLPYFFDASGKNLIAVVHDNAFVRLIRFNLSTRQTIELAHIDKSAASAAVRRKCQGTFWSQCFTRYKNKVLWLDEKDIYRVIDADSGAVTTLGPAISSLTPVYLPESEKILYYRLLTSEIRVRESSGATRYLHQKIVPLTLTTNESVVRNYPDSTAIEFEAPEIKPAFELSEAQARDPAYVASYKFDSRSRFASMHFVGDILYFMADHDLDGQHELYKANGESAPQLISDRYTEYGGVTDFFVNDQGQVFFYTVKGATTTLFKWTGD